MAVRCLSILVPAYNEAATLKEVLSTIAAVQLVGNVQKEIIVVDDCSTDQTFANATQFIQENSGLDIKLYKHEVNKGKGAAIHTAIANATGDYIIVQDADLEYDPQEFNLLLAPVIKGVADVVYGSRFMGGNPHRILFFWHSLGNKFLTFLSNMFTNLNLTDMETCYKLIDAGMAKKLLLKEQRFGFEPEVTAKLARIKGIRFYEVGISYYGRTYEEGKKIGWKDGFRAIYCVLKYNVFSRSYLRKE